MSPRPRWLQRRRAGQGGKYHSQFARYHDGQLHAYCEPRELAERCRICQPRAHTPCRTKAERVACTLCQRREADKAFWYPSRTEASHAYTLDCQKRSGDILDWRRAETVVLQAGRRGERITYTPDFVVMLPNTSEEVIEVKGARCVCKVCRPRKPGEKARRQLIADDALLKIKLFRAQDPRPLRIIDNKGRPIHV